MKNRTSVTLMTVIIVLSILTVSSQFVLLHFLDDGLKATLIGAAITIVISILMLLRSYNFEIVFIYSLLNVLFSSLIAAYSFWEIQYFYYSVTNYKLWLVICNFFVPFILCLFTHFLDYRDNLLQYRRYFRNSSILFYLFYCGIYSYIEFTPHTEGIWSVSGTNLIPFYTIAGYIEDYIYKVGTLSELFTHMIAPVLLYVPLGFLLGLLIKGHHKLLRVLLLVLIPLAAEVVQYLMKVNTVNIDDVIYALLGGFIGQLLYMLLNALSHTLKGRDFLEEESTYRSSLHF